MTKTEILNAVLSAAFGAAMLATGNYVAAALCFCLFLRELMYDHVAKLLDSYRAEHAVYTRTLQQAKLALDSQARQIAQLEAALELQDKLQLGDSDALRG